jgi:hypothetical protein
MHLPLRGVAHLTPADERAMDRILATLGRWFVRYGWHLLPWWGWVVLLTAVAAAWYGWTVIEPGHERLHQEVWDAQHDVAPSDEE